MTNSLFNDENFEKTYLHNLPKDILTKLVSLIEDEYKQKYLKTKKLLEMYITSCKFRIQEKHCGNELCKTFCFIHDTNMEGDSDDSGLDKILLVTSDSPNSFVYEEEIFLNHEDDGYSTLAQSHNTFGAICSYSCEKWFCKDHWKDNALQKCSQVNTSEIGTDIPRIYFCKYCCENEEIFSSLVPLHDI